MKQYLCEGTCDGDARVLFETEDCVAYQVSDGGGTLKVREYHVFPGIWLCYKEAETQKYTYPSSYPEGILEITHCSEGRFEYDAGDQFFYLSKGDMSISKSAGNGISVFCPTGHYHGISILLDPAAAPGCLSCILEDVKVSPASLLEKFCGENRYFIMRSTARLEHIFSELYFVPEEIQKGYFKVKILELLLFLSALDPTFSQSEQRSCSKAQVDLAKQVCRFINDHMDTRMTIEQLASRFYVSPARLKKCFYSVYGESVQAYLRAYKMRSAAQYLKNTDLPISEIAGAFGYDNSSKFAGAFRKIMGISPTEYREYPFGASGELFGVEREKDL